LVDRGVFVGCGVLEGLGVPVGTFVLVAEGAGVDVSAGRRVGTSVTVLTIWRVGCTKTRVAVATGWRVAVAGGWTIVVALG
jgi:hypothetical protein